MTPPETPTAALAMARPLQISRPDHDQDKHNITNDPGRFKAGPRFARPNPSRSGSSDSDSNAASSTKSNADLAKDLVDRGLLIFPVSTGGKKKPLTQRGFHDARNDASAWSRYPGALVGIPTAAFWVLDLDPPLAASVQTICRLLRCEWRELTAQCRLIVRTPRGGFHLYWRRTPGVAIRTVAGDIGKGIDTRGHDADGNPAGYIVAPGCMLPDGRRYQIEKGSLDALV